MSSGRGRSPCDFGPCELRLDVICPGRLAAASRRTTDSCNRYPRRASQAGSGSVFLPELLAVPPQHAGVDVDDEPPARRIARVAADRPRVGHAGARREPVVRLAGDGPHRGRSGAVVGEERRFMRMADESERAQGAAGQDSGGRRLGEEPEQGVARRAVPAVDAVTAGDCAVDNLNTSRPWATTRSGPSAQASWFPAMSRSSWRAAPNSSTVGGSPPTRSPRHQRSSTPAAAMAPSTARSRSWRPCTSEHTPILTRASFCSPLTNNGDAINSYCGGRRRRPCIPPSTARAIPVVALAAGDAR